MATAYIALGSNLGDRASQLKSARREVDALPGTAVTGASRIYESDPVGPVEQGPFLNAVLRIATELEPEQLLDELLKVERRHGREREVKWGPRTIDLDVVMYGDVMRASDTLTLPHPRLHERPFVLVPMCDIDADVLHPVLGRSMRELLTECPTMVMHTFDVDGW